MRLPRLRSAQRRTRQQVMQFGGINFGEAFSDGEFKDSENVRSDLYPCIAPRLGRELKRSLAEPGGIYAGDDLFYIDGDIVYRNGEAFGTLEHREGDAALRKLFAINSKLVVFPDKVYFNLNDKDNYELTRVQPSDWKDNYTAYFTRNDETEEFESVPKGEKTPTWATERYYRYAQIHNLEAKFEFFGGTLAFESNKIRLKGQNGKCLRKGDLYSDTQEEIYVQTNAEFDCKDGISLGGRDKTWAYNVKEKDYTLLHYWNYNKELIFVDNYTNFVALLVEMNHEYGTVGDIAVIEKILESYYKEKSNGDIDSWIRVEARAYHEESFEYSFNEGFRDLFKPGDSVKISGCYTNEENNLTLVVRDVTATELIFDDNVFTANEHAFEIGDVTISREVPDFDVVCEHNNRIWGAREDKIYASALGDPTNYNTFDGLASDSFTVAVASAGKFTGCIGYSGNMLFFKEDMMYKVMGDYPANFAMYSYNVAGVAGGSEASLVNINERLFYHSRDGVYVYTGSLPQLISYNFGMKRYEKARAFAFDTKYYISMKEITSGSSELFVYDTLRDIWLREDSTEVLGFAEHGNEKLMLCAGGDILKLESGADASVEWSVETCEMAEYINERKCYSKLFLRLDMSAGSSAEIEIRCDRGEWKSVWSRACGEHEGEFRNAYTATVAIKPTRCDRFSIRISGIGDVVIRSLIREYEIGSEV